MTTPPKRQTGLWIANNILYSDLSVLEKVILADIVSLSNGANRFFKTNQVLSDTLKVSLRTVNYAMKSLVDKGLIVSEVTYPYGSVIKKRVITPVTFNINKL